MEMLIFAAIAFIAVLLVRRREALALRWAPTRHTWAAVGTGLAAFALSAALLLFDEASPVARTIHYGLIYVGCGVAVPWGYTLLVERQPPAAMGLRRERWRPSLALNVGLGSLFTLVLLAEADLGAIDAGQLSQATFTLLVGTLFEWFLYYGFIHLRLEKAFGPIPAILVTAALYVSWHAGTQLPREPDLLLGIIKLFLVGVMYQSIFSLTHNLLAIWPFFLGVGALMDHVINIDAVDPVSVQFPWAVASALLMAATGVLLALLFQHPSPTRPRPLVSASK